MQWQQVLVYGLFGIYVAWTWVRWLRDDKTHDVTWRAAMITAGLCSATISTILAETLYLHAVFFGMYPYHDRAWLFFIRVGTPAASLGLIAALIGNGKRRLSLTGISALNLLIWWVNARAQQGPGLPF
jgi:hypothetical protein